MEIHIESDHGMSDLNCDQCEKIFISEWRLKLHKHSHTLTVKKRNCHYFNSGKVCPFEKLGCKFEHILSKDCKFGAQCSFNMCQFKH